MIGFNRIPLQIDTEFENLALRDSDGPRWLDTIESIPNCRINKHLNNSIWSDSVKITFISTRHSGIYFSGGPRRLESFERISKLFNDQELFSTSSTKNPSQIPEFIFSMIKREWISQKNSYMIVDTHQHLLTYLEFWNLALPWVMLFNGKI